MCEDGCSGRELGDSSANGLPAQNIGITVILRVNPCCPFGTNSQVSKAFGLLEALTFRCINCSTRLLSPMLLSCSYLLGRAGDRIQELDKYRNRHRRLVVFPPNGVESRHRKYGRDGVRGYHRCVRRHPV